ncbi:RNA 2',3'-cyclic phosphodiesterase [Candidatus Pacearchaeota archaeon]|nr:MAG: RNA 2',3'-cyclic phosphodiesterase [Candidatus Pacearchaeota archaeon]
MIRSFLAIDLPLELKKKLSALNTINIPSSLKIKWVEEKNFHLTLKFFGNISENFLEKLYKRTQKAVKDFPFIELRIKKTGFFPEKGLPRVVWIGLDSQDDILLKLYKTLEKEFKKLKIKSSKEAFHPHITLFRIKSIGNLKEFNAYFEALSKNAISLEGFSFQVKELTFFKSTLYSTGPVYQPMYKVPLKIA